MPVRRVQGCIADPHPRIPLRNDRLGGRPTSCAHQAGAAQPPPAVTPLGLSMLGVVVLPLLTRIRQVAAAFPSPGGPTLSGMQPPGVTAEVAAAYLVGEKG